MARPRRLGHRHRRGKVPSEGQSPTNQVHALDPELTESCSVAMGSLGCSRLRRASAFDEGAFERENLSVGMSTTGDADRRVRLNGGEQG